jgi:hypothetical protein
MTRQLLSPLLLAVLLGTTACLPNPGRIEQSGTQDQSSITAQDVDRFGSDNALQVVQQLRPSWLGYRPPQAEGNRAGYARSPEVYIRIRCGGYTCLRWLELDRVEEIDYVTPREATRRWGSRHADGVIDVRLGEQQR